VLCPAGGQRAQQRDARLAHHGSVRSHSRAVNGIDTRLIPRRDRADTARRDNSGMRRSYHETCPGLLLSSDDELLLEASVDDELNQPREYR
jgi:hypothetical protein